MDIIEITYIICFFCIGTLFGSFFSLATYRLPRKQDIIVKRSYCPSCKHELTFFDLVPVLSYILRLGKCKYCKDKISPRYIVFELLNGILFSALYIALGNSMITYMILVIYIILFVIIGSNVMKNKMSEEEKKNIQKIYSNIKTENNISSKTGVFNIELLIAMFAFAVYFTAAIYMSRNYRETLLIANMRSLAFNIASNKLEEAKSKTYDNLAQVNIYEETSDNYSFVSEIEVNEYVYDSMGYNEKFAKKITSIVTYMYGDKENEVRLESIKHKRGDL